MREDAAAKFDDEINDVARSLTSGGPRPAFRRSVRVRLEAQPGGVRPRAAWVGATAAVVAVIVIAVVSWTPNRDAVEEVSAPGSNVVDAEPAPPVAPPTVDDVVRSTASAVVAAVPMSAPAAEPVEVDPLDVMPLDVEPLEIPMIAVDTLDVDPLVIQQ